MGRPGDMQGGHQGEEWVAADGGSDGRSDGRATDEGSDGATTDEQFFFFVKGKEFKKNVVWKKNGREETQHGFSGSDSFWEPGNYKKTTK